MKLPRYITLCCENACFSHENRELQPVLQFIYLLLLFILPDEKGKQAQNKDPKTNYLLIYLKSTQNLPNTLVFCKYCFLKNLI
jgi:hypothetical protein